MADSVQRRQWGLLEKVFLGMVTLLGSALGYIQMEMTAQNAQISVMRETLISGISAQVADLRVQMATRPTSDKTAEETARIWKAIADSQRDVAVWSSQTKYNAEAIVKIQADMRK